MKKVLILLGLFSSCYPPKDTSVVFKKITNFDTCKNYSIIYDTDSTISRNTNTEAHVEYFSKKRISRIYLKVLNKGYGHFFDFRLTGQLSKYLYLLGDSLHDSYEITFSYKTNQFKEQGNAYVGNMDNTIADTTYKRYSLLFSYFPRQKIAVSISTDSINFRKVELHNSNFMPMLGEYDYDAKKNEKYIFLRIEANDLLIDLPNLPDTVITTRKIYF